MMKINLTFIAHTMLLTTLLCVANSLNAQSFEEQWEQLHASARTEMYNNDYDILIDEGTEANRMTWKFTLDTTVHLSYLVAGSDLSMQVFLTEADGKNRQLQRYSYENDLYINKDTYISLVAGDYSITAMYYGTIRASMMIVIGMDPISKSLLSISEKPNVFAQFAVAARAELQKNGYTAFEEDVTEFDGVTKEINFPQACSIAWMIAGIDPSMKATLISADGKEFPLGDAMQNGAIWYTSGGFDVLSGTYTVKVVYSADIRGRTAICFAKKQSALAEKQDAQAIKDKEQALFAWSDTNLRQQMSQNGFSNIESRVCSGGTESVIISESSIAKVYVVTLYPGLTVQFITPIGSRTSAEKVENNGAYFHEMTAHASAGHCIVTFDWADKKPHGAKIYYGTQKYTFPEASNDAAHESQTDAPEGVSSTELHRLQKIRLESMGYTIIYDNENYATSSDKFVADLTMHKRSNVVWVAYSQAPGLFCNAKIGYNGEFSQSKNEDLVENGYAFLNGTTDFNATVMQPIPFILTLEPTGDSDEHLVRLIVGEKER
jgi:hypothetical protein